MAGNSDRPDNESPNTDDVSAHEGAGGPAEAGEPKAEESLARTAPEEGGVDQVAEAASQPGTEEEQLASQLGVQKYVHAAFFAAGILAAYLLGKILQAAWNTLAGWPEAVRQVPMLLEYTEQERGSVTLVIGAVLGAALILRYYRRPSVRRWATDVAGELSRVTWPSKDTVTNGTIVVLVAGAVATFYVAVLDRLWSYLTNLVYGT